MFERIAVIKTAWSEDYRGAEVIGNYGYVFPDHEKVNFLPDPEGNFLAYLPPTGGNGGTGYDGAPPRPKTADDWLVFAVAKKPFVGGLWVVGWYENATFMRCYEERPEYKHGEPWFGRGEDGGKITYTVRAPNAVAIDGPNRTMCFAGDRLKRHIAYLRGNGEQEAWRAELAQALLGYRNAYLAEAADEIPLFVSPEDGVPYKYGNGGLGGGPESPFHMALKEWVRDNPGLVSPSYAEAEADIEVPLLSGDRIDCSFDRGDRIAVVEVKSWISNQEDLLRGIFQCIKYRAVMEAMTHDRAVTVDAVLVTEKPVPAEHHHLLARHNVIHFQAPKDRT